MSVEKLVEHFSGLEDLRGAGKVDHRLIDIWSSSVMVPIHLPWSRFKRDGEVG